MIGLGANNNCAQKQALNVLVIMPFVATNDRLDFHQIFDKIVYFYDGSPLCELKAANQRSFSPCIGLHGFIL